MRLIHLEKFKKHDWIEFTSFGHHAKISFALFKNVLAIYK
jgi:hypothetical protein